MPDKKPAQANVFAQRATDGFVNFVSRLGVRSDNTLSAGTYDFNYLTRNRILIEAMYRGSWVVGKIIDAPAEDMTRAGIDITTKDKADIRKLKNQMSALQIWHSLCLLAKWGEMYGGAIAVIQIEGQKLDTPLVLDTITKDQFKGLTVYDRWLLNPQMTPVIDSGPDIGLPKFYQIVTNPLAVDPTIGERLRRLFTTLESSVTPALTYRIFKRSPR